MTYYEDVGGPKLEHTVSLRWVGTMDNNKIESLEVIVDDEQG